MPDSGGSSGRLGESRHALLSKIDVSSRGRLLSSVVAPLRIGNQFMASFMLQELCWSGVSDLLPELVEI